MLNGVAASLEARVREVFAWGEATMFLRLFSSLFLSSSSYQDLIRSVLIRTTACEHRPPWGAPGWRTDQPVCLAPPLLQSSCCSSPFRFHLLLLPLLLRLLFYVSPHSVFQYERCLCSQNWLERFENMLNYFILVGSNLLSNFFHVTLLESLII